MKNETTLVILIPGFPVNEADDICLPSHQNFIRSINKNFPSIHLLILAFQYPYEKRKYEWNGNAVFAFGGKNKGGLSRWWLWQKITRKLDSLKKNNNIIGVLSFWTGECAYVGKKWSQKNNILHYAWSMGQDGKKENAYIKRSGLKEEELIALSDFNRDELKTNHGLNPVAVIPFGVDPAQFTTGDHKRNIDIISVGSLIPLKQFHLCIGIVEALKEKFPDIRMMICGAGPEKQRLDALILEKGLTLNIFLANEKPHPEVLLLMKQSKLLLHPSSYEGFGIVCLEALAAGASVISFIRPMKKDIEKWFVVDSVAAMAERVETILNDPGDGSPHYPYTIDKTTKQVLSLFGV